MYISQETINCINILKKHHYDAYVVGGAIRDALINLIADDFDITTNALPDVIKEIFMQEGYHIINLNGEKHGTITVKKDEIIEITTYRKESIYSDNRHPDHVEFCLNIEEDLSRRDFTINAIAYDLEKIIDPFNGKEDLNNKIIRAVNDPYFRFEEDALRILRAMRFQAKLGFEIEENTKNAMIAKAHLLKNISRERIHDEINKMIIGDYFYKLFDSEIKGIFAYIFDEIADYINNDFIQKSKYHTNTLLNHSLSVVRHVKKDYILKLAAFFHDVGKISSYQEFLLDGVICHHYLKHEEASINIVYPILKRLKYSSKDISKIIFLIKYHDVTFSSKNLKKSIKKIINTIDDNLIEEYFYDLLNLKQADRVDHQNCNDPYTFEEIVNAFKEIIENNEPFKIKHLAINGNDLLSLGYKGKVISEILNKVINKVIEDKLANNKEAIIKYIHQAFKNNMN